MELQTLQDIYEQYPRQLAKVIQAAPAFAGVWGMGDDPRNHPCHAQFYEGVEAFVEQLLASNPSEELVFQVTQWILITPARYKGHDAYWYMYAAQGLCMELIGRLTPAHCAQLREAYDEHFPKRDRMPVQEKLYKQLKKSAGKR